MSTLRSIIVQPSGTETHHTVTVTLDQERATITAYTSADGRWYLDFVNDEDLAVRGIALAAGVDLLAPYRHLGVPPGILFVAGGADPDLAAFREGRAFLLYMEADA